MDNLSTLLSKDLLERKGCESCSRAPSTHVMFIHPKNKGGGCCAVFHICEACQVYEFNFGDENTYKFLKKLV